MTASLDIVIPTYNRPDLLETTLRSIQCAHKPETLELTVIVADNNSKPENASANLRAIAKFPDLKIRYVFETRQGRSWALNAGLAISTADFIGFIDDDEKLDSAWLEVATRYLHNDEYDYIGGPYKPDWAAEPPDWLPAHSGNYAGVLGWIEQSSEARSYEAFDGTLCGGNSIIRREVVSAIGGFSTKLGRSGSNLMGGEDEELHRRLKAHGSKGWYDPALAIYHLIPASRMTRTYHLRWAYWSGVSNGSRLAWDNPEPVPHFFGIPRYRYMLAAVGIKQFLASCLSRQRSSLSRGFTGLMNGTYVLGMIYGKYIYKSQSISQR